MLLCAWGQKVTCLKNIGSTELLSSLRALDRGEEAVSRKMVSRIVQEFARTPESRSSDEKLLVNLSPRELDVIREIESGATNIEIAQHLFLSVNTVKHHIRNVMGKLGSKNRRQVASFARKNGLDRKISPIKNS